jgi:lysozyme family protein
MADFWKAIEKIKGYEKGYANSPHDYGGETNCGLSKRQYPELDMKKVTWEFPAPEGMVSAIPIYMRDYWDKLSLDRVNDQAVAEEMMDVAVNQGWGYAALSAQHMLNLLVPGEPSLKEDGLMGPKTVEAINSYGRPKVLVKAINGMQFIRYVRICEENSDQEYNFRGWLERVEF